MYGMKLPDLKLRVSLEAWVLLEDAVKSDSVTQGSTCESGAVRAPDASLVCSQGVDSGRRTAAPGTPQPLGLSLCNRCRPAGFSFCVPLPER